MASRVEKVGGVMLFLIWKHTETGELLGPSVHFGVPATVVYALMTDEGWLEVTVH
jgi:hypothetical protein